MGMSTGIATTEKCTEVPQKNNEIDPAIPLLSIYLKKTKILTRKDTCIPLPRNVHCSTIYNSEDMEAT